MKNKTELDHLCETFNIFRDGFPYERLAAAAPGKAGKLLCSLIKPIVESCRRDEPNKAVWLKPTTRLKLLQFHDPEINGVRKDTSASNYRGYLRQLHDSNIIYQCGPRNAVLFTIEPNILSWSCFSKTPYITPRSMLSLLNSYEKMFNEINDATVGSATTTDQILAEIAKFFSDLISRTEPSIMAPCWDGVLSVESYIRQLKRTFSLHDSLKGIKKDSLDTSEINGILLSEIKSKSAEFDEIIPVSENLEPHKFNKKVGTGVNPQYKREMNRLDDVPTSSLDVVNGNFLHLLQAFQRMVLPEAGFISKSLKVYNDYGQEEMYADNIRNALLRVGQLNREVILSWINWFATFKAVQFHEEGILINSCGLRLLYKTWDEFRSMSEGASWVNITDCDDFPADGSLYKRMTEFRKKSTDDRFFEECAMRFGFVVTCWFLIAQTDEDIAFHTLDNHLNKVKDFLRTDKSIQDSFMEALYQTLIRRCGKYSEKFMGRCNFIDEPVYKNIRKPMIERFKNSDSITMDDPELSEFFSTVEAKLSAKNIEINA